MRSRKLCMAVGILAVAFGVFVASAQAQNGADLFRGRTISILIGAGAGGGADVYTRLFAHYYGRFLPGNPTVVAQDLPGAGGLEVANELYNVAPKDGTRLGTFLSSTALEPLFGSKDARFDTRKFTWIGNMLKSDVTACVAGKPSGIKTWQDLKKRVTVFGSSGFSSATSVQAKAVATLLGLEIKVIKGYQGTRSSNLAMHRGELDATCGLYMSTVLSQFWDQVKSGEIVVWMTFGHKRVNELPNVPTIFELVKNAADRQLAELIFDQGTIARPIAAPPGLDPQVAAALRKGFMDTMQDSEFLAAARQARFRIDPDNGEETQKQYASFYAYPKTVVDRAKTIMGLN